MQVHKFGGSSIGHEHGFEQLFKIAQKESDSLVIVVSACGKTTDNLLKAARMATMKDTMYTNVLQDILDLSLAIPVFLQIVSNRALQHYKLKDKQKYSSFYA